MALVMETLKNRILFIHIRKEIKLKKKYYIGVNIDKQCWKILCPNKIEINFWCLYPIRFARNTLNDHFIQYYYFIYFFFSVDKKWETQFSSPIFRCQNEKGKSPLSPVKEWREKMNLRKGIFDISFRRFCPRPIIKTHLK